MRTHFRFRKALAFLLAALMILGMAPVMALGAGAADSSTSDAFYRIVHLDCGRKYFSVDSIKKLIDSMAANDYNQLELAVGNAGLRFLLDDMSVTVSDTVSYTDEQIRNAVVEGNIAQNSSNDGSYLTEDDMDAIISYANSKGIEIVPLVNMPGHMNAVLYVNPAYKLTENSKGTSAETLDLNNQEAYAFGLALLQKYVDYFASKGVKYFNFGADEYANDLYNPYFSLSGASVTYTTLVSYMNDCAAIIKNADMTPRAFNDFVYYNRTAGVDTDIEVCYWSNQWGGSPYVTADVIGNAGYTLINTNQNWYYVPGSEGYTLEGAISSIQENGYNQFKNASGSTLATASGTMVCIWSDDPNALSDTETVANAATLISPSRKRTPINLT